MNMGNEERSVHVCPTVVALQEQYTELEEKYNRLDDKYRELITRVGKIMNSKISDNRTEIESTVRDIIDDVIEEKVRMGDWPNG